MVAALILLVAFLLAIALHETQTVLEFQQNGQPIAGLVCEGILPAFKRTTDPAGRIVLDESAVKQDPTAILLTLSREGARILNTTFRVRPGTQVIYNFSGGGLTKTTIRKWGLITFTDKVVQTPFTLQNPDKL